MFPLMHERKTSTLRASAQLDVRAADIQSRPLAGAECGGTKEENNLTDRARWCEKSHYHIKTSDSGHAVNGIREWLFVKG